MFYDDFLDENLQLIKTLELIVRVYFCGIQIIINRKLK